MLLDWLLGHWILLVTQVQAFYLQFDQAFHCGLGSARSGCCWGCRISPSSFSRVSGCMSGGLTRSLGQLSLGGGVSPASSGSWELVSEFQEAEVTEPTELSFSSGQEYWDHNLVPDLELTAEEEREFLAVQTLTSLINHRFPSFELLESGSDLRGGPVSGLIRVARAVRAGIGARHKFEGVWATTISSSPLGIKNRWYVVLRCRTHPQGFVTSNFNLYARAVKGVNQPFDPQSVSHSFPTLSEVVAFLAGARAQWPQLLL